MKQAIKTRLKSLRQIPGKILFRMQLGDNIPTVISNDCYGAEIYRWLQVPYNTPFVGLMVMAPCYIKMLSNLQEYLGAELTFISDSKYPELNNFRQKHSYPLGLLKDVEIHFLHYKSARDAMDKWTRRLNRINKESMAVKFSMDKDFANQNLLEQFDLLPYQKKLSVSMLPYTHSPSNIVVPGFATDAGFTFRQSLRVVNIKEWLNGNTRVNRTFAEKVMGYILWWSLKR